MRGFASRRVRTLFSHGIAFLARQERPRLLVKGFLSFYTRWNKVDLDEFEMPPGGYLSYRAFHGRAIRPNARPIDKTCRAVFPSDGVVLDLGHIRDGRIGQVKGIDYDLATLLGPYGSTEKIRFDGGWFVNLYLPVPSYHRWCAPFDGVLRSEVNISGDCLSLGIRSLMRNRDVFVRNERLVQILEGTDFFLILVAVGGIAATNISSTRPTNQPGPVPYQRGQELGAFWLGSTIVLLFPSGVPLVPLQIGQKIRMGTPLVP